MEEIKAPSKAKVLFVIVTAIALLLAVGASTYAWFSFSPSTNVEPLSSTVSDGDTSLLIANNKNGEFAKSCTLVLDNTVEVLRPLSTLNLDKFYVSIGQNSQGVSVLFEERKNAEHELMHGFVYLKSYYGANDIYFNESGLSMGSDAQTKAALRLALKLTTRKGTETFIFKLDAMGTDGAAQTQTIVAANSVISSVDAGGTATFVADPAKQIGDYFVNKDGGLKPGKASLGTLEEDEVGTVEYWLYLEGCDDNCINEVQSKDINLQLSFAGITRK